MMRTAFFLIFFIFAAVFGVFGQGADFSFERFGEPAGQEQDKTDFESAYNDSEHDVVYNDPLINQLTEADEGQAVKNEPEQTAAIYEEATTGVYEQITYPELPEQTAQATLPAPVLQPAKPMPPPPMEQPVQSAYTEQSVQGTAGIAVRIAQTQQTAGVQGIVPLTWELVSLMQNTNISLNDLNYFLSRSFTMIISEQYDNPKIEIKNGALVVNEQQRASSLLFTNNQIGKLHGFPVSGSIDVFEVIFKSGNKDIAMRFRKTNQNIFELYSAVIDTRPYTLHSDEGLPQLSISSNMGRGGDSEVQAYPSANTAGRTRNVEGAGSLNKSGVVEYIKTQRPPLNDSEIERIVQTYFDEAAFENINHDIAIAQMLHASNFLKNNQRVSGFNYSGLIELPNWEGKFSNMTEGVRAHIQHIKGYASKTLNRQQIVDPRYYLLVNLKYLGTVKTFDQLYGKWTASPENYKQNIERILNGLYQYSSK